MKKSILHKIGSTKIDLSHYDIPSLEDTLEALGLDLILHSENTSQPYANGPCPFHYHEKNHTTFVYYPNIQRCHCLSCHPEYMDSVGLWMYAKKVPFLQAVEEICTPKSAEEIYLALLDSQEALTSWSDKAFLAARMRAIYQSTPFEVAFSLAQKVTCEVEAGNYVIAERLISKYEY